MTTLAYTENVSKYFGKLKALDEVSLQIGESEMVGMLGPNGAGKSTLISLLAGLRRPSSGVVRLFGQDPLVPTTRRHLGVTPQLTGFPETLTVAETFDLVAAHFSDPLPLPQLLTRFGLNGLEKRRCAKMSGGQQRRLAVALAVVGRPKLLILDEPTTGLDVESRQALWASAKELRAEGTTILVTSHYLEEIEALAERVVVIDEGRVLADATVSVVRSLVSRNRMQFTIPTGTSLPALPDATVSQEQTGGVDKVTLTCADSDEVVRLLVQQQVPFNNLEIAASSLEEAFLALTNKTAA